MHGGTRLKPAATTPPSPWLTRWMPLAPPGASVLDVACGWGRNLRWMRDAGYRVTGIDRDTSTLSDMKGEEIIKADLEDGSPWPLPGRTFDVVLVSRYLYRPLFPVLEESVAKGGLLIYETFMEGNEAHGRPRNPDHLLKHGELLTAFPHLSVVAFEQGAVETCGTGIIQRIVLSKDSRPRRLDI